MKTMCQLYLPAFYRSYGKESVRKITSLLEDLKEVGFDGIYLIALFEDGGFDNGFDIVEYTVNHKFGSQDDLWRLLDKAHALDLMVGVDVVPNHVSDKHFLAQSCLSGISGYEDALYVVSKDEAARLTEAGVPSFFGKLAYSDFGDKYVRSTFADYHQLNLNWQNQKVQEYFARLFEGMKQNGIDFARVDCGMMLLEDVSKADKANPMACMDPRASIEAIRKVSGGMPLFFEWFDPSTADMFNDMPECWALDCSYVMTGQLNTDWHHPKLVPLVGGHDQMTVADRGMNVYNLLRKMKDSEYGFLDIQTLIDWKTDPAILPDDGAYDADLKNPNQRYRARRPIKPVIDEFFKPRY